MQSRSVILLAAAVILLAAAVSAHSGETSAPTPTWTGRSVVLVAVDGRTMAPACPTLGQIRHFTEQHGKWDKQSLDCRYLLAGNFINALVLEDSGEFVRMKFTFAFEKRPRLLSQHDTFWTPQSHYRIAR